MHSLVLDPNKAMLPENDVRRLVGVIAVSKRNQSKKESSNVSGKIKTAMDGNPRALTNNHHPASTGCSKTRACRNSGRCAPCGTQVAPFRKPRSRQSRSSSFSELLPFVSRSL